MPSFRHWNLASFLVAAGSCNAIQKSVEFTLSGGNLYPKKTGNEMRIKSDQWVPSLFFLTVYSFKLQSLSGAGLWTACTAEQNTCSVTSYSSSLLVIDLHAWMARHPSHCFPSSPSSLPFDSILSAQGSHHKNKTSAFILCLRICFLEPRWLG